MKRIDRIKLLSTDEFANWLEENWSHDDDPCLRWFDEKYCSKCEPLEIDEREYAYCEVHHKCRFFQELNEMPIGVETMKLWLESEEDE